MPLVLILSLCCITFITMKGSRILMTLYAVDMGAGPFETGILFALYGLVPFLLAIAAGRIADRFDNRLLIYWGLGTYTISLVLPFFFPSLAILFIVAPLWGFTSMLWVVATQSLVGKLSTSETRTRNFSYYSLGESTGSVLGPIIVGLSIDMLSHQPTFLIMAAIPALCVLAVVVRRHTIPHTAPVSTDVQAPRNMKDLLALPAMRNALLSNAAVMTGLDLFNLYMPIYGHSLGFTATTIGLIMGAFGAAAFITRLAIPPISKRYGERAMLAGALAMSGVAFMMFPLTTSAVLLAAAAFALGLGLGCGQPLSMILAFNAGPPERSAESISMRLAVSYGAHVVVPPVFGVIGAAMGVAPIFWTCAMLMGGGSLLNRKPKPL
ncbi:MAG: MFS transporter [Burkholderiales bacterium]|jgi:MFS family permease|nr:MFS transporter [Burkholderiales bacterium]